MRIVAIALLSLLVSSLPPAQPKPVSISFTVSPEGFVIVPATLGSSLPVKLILDTGAGVDVLAPSVIAKLNGRPAGQFTAFRMTGERLEISLFVIPRLAVGPLVKKDALVGSWDLLDTMHLDGIIAANDLREQPFTLDFAAKEMTFETPQSLAKRRAEGKVSPLQLDEQRGIALDLFSSFLLGGQTGQCEIDTGSPGTEVNLRFMAPLEIDKDGPEVKKREFRNATGAMETRYETNLPEIALASAPEIKVVNPRVSFSTIIYDCVAGLNFWAGKTLTVDIPGRQIIVSAGSTKS